ncbi:MAG: F0F1 ATP synthase subunit B [Candidatus Faecousia sp.]|nr:F0F1 ATP synthase subunit B [Clostridiales bacterium]MCI6937663.1 F0F1 ATP synthase subunit B [Clostridiales bacterium]MDD5883972.1 F0F1 ATP synthase subunit B [Bacillota bacterium]MDY4598727.1 F0F1 ATP synthase subunit B [Candidatus Faecousia sp.]
MDTLYQSLVTVNPVTLIAQICNLFLQLLIVKIFFLDKIKAIIDQRREAADKQITEAENAKSEALAIKQTYEQNMLEAKAKADDLLMTAQRTANSRSEEIISQAQQQAAQIKSKAAADIELEKKKALNEAKNEISDLAMAIAGKVVARELNAGDQADMIDRFIDELGDNV